MPSPVGHAWRESHGRTDDEIALVEESIAFT